MVDKVRRTIDNNTRVAVIGGGPAGSFFALHLLKYAHERGVNPKVTIYQQRDFTRQGPEGCKGCAGVLSISLLRNLRDLDLTIPAEIIRSTIDQYAVHSPYSSISISSPEKDIRIASIYRGAGPKNSFGDQVISFDNWLLEQAKQQGAEVCYQIVTGIQLDNKRKIEVDGGMINFDLIVLATGVNTVPLHISGLGYIAPKTTTMTQNEIYVGLKDIHFQLGNTAHAFLLPYSDIVFGTLVPKGLFINVSILSSRETALSVDDFLYHGIVRNLLPLNYEKACGCRPKTVIGPARNYFGDGFVAVGDAAVSRLYKDGIGSALLTARQAASTVTNYGYSAMDFATHYRLFCESISVDNKWGQRLFRNINKSRDSRIFIMAEHRMLGSEQNNLNGPQPFTRSAWGMFTGSYSYKEIAGMVFRLPSLVKFLFACFIEVLRRAFSREPVVPRALHVGGRRIVILGSGFGGTSVLKNLVPLLNRNENVEMTMISDENFFLFSPLLYEAATGSIETRHIAYPIRRLHWRDRFNFLQGVVEKIDLRDRKVITSQGVLDFDNLVLALGGVTDTDNLAIDESNVFMMRTLYDAMVLRNHIIKLFELAVAENDVNKRKQMLTFVVAGAGYMGVQMVTELRDLIYKDLIRFYKTIYQEEISLLLLEKEDVLLEELDLRLRAYIRKYLKRTNIDTRLCSKITRVRNNQVEINGTDIVPTYTLILTTGIKANPRIAEMEVDKDDLGRVLVNQYMEVPGFSGVYAVGDCANYKDIKSGLAIPPRAHTAVRQAKVVATNLLCEIRGEVKKPYSYSNPAVMVSLGSASAVMRIYGFHIYGFPARFLLALIYSFLVTGSYNRIRIIMDWLLSLLFGKDTTLLKITKS